MSAPRGGVAHSQPEPQHEPGPSGSTVVTPGGVLFSGGSTPTTAIAPLDAIDFRAAGAGTGITRAKKGAAHLDPAVLRALGIHLG